VENLHRSTLHGWMRGFKAARDLWM
jgi:hypothetical protein